jgi:hypothetical protein
MNSRPAGRANRWYGRTLGIARRRLLLAAATASILLLALGANAFASIPDHNQVYYACVQNGSLPLPTAGSIRMIDTDRGQSCNRYESLISWNANGVAGATGATGPSGLAGPTGETGAAGTEGATGATGPEGATGTAGDVGPTGAMGMPGPTGAEGAVGPSGEPGPDGAAGPTGDTGPMGPMGESGPEGQAGANGLPGEVGPSGPTGPSGEAGAAGPSGPSGPAGAGGMSVYGNFYSNITSNVAANAAIPIPFSVTYSSGIFFDSSGITILTPGTYQAFFTVIPSSATQPIGLAINGTVPFPSGSFGPVGGTAGTPVNGQLVFTAAANDKITLVNKGAATISFTGNAYSSANVTLIIEQIGAATP